MLRDFLGNTPAPAGGMGSFPSGPMQRSMIVEIGRGGDRDRGGGGDRVGDRVEVMDMATEVEVDTIRLWW